MSRRISIRLSKDEDEKIIAWSQQYCLSRSVIIRLLINYALKKIQHPSELLLSDEK